MGFSVFVGLVNKCADVVIGLTPSCSRQVKGDGRKVKQSELELHKRTGRGAAPSIVKTINLFGQSLDCDRGKTSLGDSKVKQR